MDAPSSTQDHPLDLPPPGSDLNLQDPQVVIDLFQRATQALLNHPRRRGSLIELPRRGRLLMTGDLHDHGLNFQRIVRLAALQESPDHYLILHEIIHGPGRINGRDLSVRTLARAAALLLRHPDQVFFLLANHELAQRSGEDILKGGTSVVADYNAGLDFLYGQDAEAVREATAALIRHMPLAVRCANGILCCHSLPAPRKIDVFDPGVLDRLLTEEDLQAGGSAHLMVWGRHHTQKVADELGEAWGVNLFVMGHQPAEMGYETEGQTMLVLASDHEHGVALPIDLGRTYTRDELVSQIVPLAAVVL